MESPRAFGRRPHRGKLWPGSQTEVFTQPATTGPRTLDENPRRNVAGAGTVPCRVGRIGQSEERHGVSVRHNESSGDAHGAGHGHRARNGPRPRNRVCRYEGRPEKIGAIGVSWGYLSLSISLAPLALGLSKPRNTALHVLQSIILPWRDDGGICRHQSCRRRPLSRSTLDASVTPSCWNCTLTAGMIRDCNVRLLACVGRSSYHSRSRRSSPR